MMQPTISVIIPARNEGKRVARAIMSIAGGRSTAFPIEFIIVDDASEDGCCTDLEGLLNPDVDAAIIRVIRLEQWSGIPYARNVGASYACAPVFLITDANVESCSTWDIPVFRDLRQGRALCATIADKNSSWKGYGCVLDLASMSINWILDPKTFNGYVPVSPCTGTVLHADLFRRLGGYDTAMPAYGAAEPEFSVRLWLYGCEIISCPDLLFYHRFRPAEERQPFLDQIEFLQIMNYLRFGLLYKNDRGIVRLLDHWSRAAPNYFTDALKQVEAGNIWERRHHLQKNLARDFNWYTDHFGLKEAV
jgi:glycosyltransferase involved in cell wall biosynthesis